MIKRLFLILLLWPSALLAQDQNSYKRLVQEQNVPPEVVQELRDQQLNKRYEISFHLNPFYLPGDFNGDGEPDIAALIKERSTGKIGIAVFHGSTHKVFIIGDGKPLGNGGDDFRWMNIWRVLFIEASMRRTLPPCREKH